ncbi:MAG: leucine-rich repeat domain-containing protein [Treponemataceae bacterium]|nr:leucine-rich repeat domain-containing protein [Treponemataceae bacterium]
MNKKWVAVFAALAVTTAAFAAKVKYPAYLDIQKTAGCGGEQVVVLQGVKNRNSLPAELVIPDGVTKIGGAAFYGCTSLASVSIPDSVTEIGDYAFGGCTSLKEIQFNGTTAQWQAIQGSSQIQVSVVRCSDGRIGIEGVPEYLKTAGTTVMGYDGTLPANLVIPDGVTEIGNGTFYNCTSLASVTIPASVAQIGYGAFDGCTSLKEIQFKGTIVQWQAIQGTVQIQAVVRCSDGKIGIEGLPEYLKTAGTALTGYTGTVPANLVIPDGVTEIGERAFSNCTSLASVSFPSSVTAIADRAFWGCTSLTIVTIPASVTAIGNYAFSGCTSLTEIQFKGTTAQWRAIRGRAIQGSSEAKKVATISCSDGILSAEEVPEYLEMDGTKVTGYTGIVPANLVIPDGVTEISNDAFVECIDIESVTIPSSVTYIKDGRLVDTGLYGSYLFGTFRNCTYLERVMILGRIAKIPNFIFYNCTSIKNITVPDSVTSIGQAAFFNCASLKNVNIPKSVTEIGICAFYGCASLSDVTIPDGVTKIAGETFSNCTSLKSVTIPDGVSEIGEWAFYGCTSLTSVTIPGSVTKIGKNAFLGCTSLKSVNIPRGVIQIAPEMFSGCTSLTTLVIPRSVRQIGDGAFSKCSPNLKIQYDGTKAQWNAISGDKPKATVQCSDGVL